MKKWIACILALCMLCSALPALAASKAMGEEIVPDSVEGEIIVSAHDAEKSGKWKATIAVLNYDGKSTFYSEGEADISFKSEQIQKGNYEVYLWAGFHAYNPDKQYLTVKHAGKESETFAYVKLNEGEERAPGWVSLGVFDFLGSGDESVDIHATGNNIRATAVKFVPTDKEALGRVVEEEQKESTDAKIANSIDANPLGTCYYTDHWTFSSAVLGPMTQAPNSLWVAGVGPEAYVEYNPDIQVDCNVRISVYMLYWHENQTTDVKYTVFHNGKTDEFHLDPTTVTESQWITLGTFDFGGNGEDYVLLECTGKGNEMTNTRASTISFEVLNDAETDPNSPMAVWETKYVTPQKDTNSQYMAQKKTMAPMDTFSDMTDHWAYYDVEYMANEGLVSGVAEGIFDPEAKISRAEYVTILDRAMKYELVSGESYADVVADAWYAPYIATAKANGILNGLPTDGGFKPDQPITREEMALFTYNAIKATGKNDEWVSDMPDGWDNFTDTASVSDWAQEALKYLIQTGIIKGTSDTTVSPKENATRAQGAVILKRFMQQFVWAGPPSEGEWVMTFNDEFFGDSLNFDVWISESYQTVDTINSSRGPDNVEVKDGSLYMLTKKQKVGDKDWTTAHIWVNPEVFRQSYGYFEARYKICEASGINNAFWLMTLPKLITDKKQNFEIDVNEGHYPNEVCTTYHYYSTGEHQSNHVSHRSVYDLSRDYHTYGLEWTETELIFYLDGKEISRFENVNAHIPLFPYLSSAVISWAGSIKDDADGTAQIVDYVRVWQTKADAENAERTLINQPYPEQKPKEEVKEEKPALPPVEMQEIDNTDYDKQVIVTPEFVGTWANSVAVLNYDGGAHQYTNAYESVADFKLDKIKSGEYKVYYWRLPHEVNKVKEQIYLVKADGTEQVIGEVVLTPPQGTVAEPGWVLLDTVKLSNKDAFCVKFTESVTRASAIKLVPVQ